MPRLRKEVVAYLAAKNPKVRFQKATWYQKRIQEWERKMGRAARVFGREGSVFAWWNLSSEMKLALDNARRSGRFGGIPNQAPYMWVQEGSTPEGKEGAQKAGIHPTNFVEIALSSSEEAIADIVVGAMANAG